MTNNGVILIIVTKKVQSQKGMARRDTNDTV